MRHEAGGQEYTRLFLENPAHAEPGPLAFRGQGAAVPGMGREKKRQKGHLGHSPRGTSSASRTRAGFPGCQEKSRFLGKETQTPGGDMEDPSRFALCTPQICWTWLRWC